MAPSSSHTLEAAAKESPPPIMSSRSIAEMFRRAEWLLHSKFEAHVAAEVIAAHREIEDMVSCVGELMEYLLYLCSELKSLWLEGTAA